MPRVAFNKRMPVKKSTLLQEAMRRIGNISLSLPKEETIKEMTKYSNMLRISGYSARERLHFIKGALQRHKEMIAEVERGERTSLFRVREQIQEAKDAKGGLSAASWFLGGQVKATVTCQATPGGILADALRKAIGTTRDGQKRLTLEDGGAPVTIGLQVKRSLQHTSLPVWGPRMLGG